MTRWTFDDAPDQSGRTVLVTGANSGLGFWTTVALARKGARVLMACRNPAKAEAALKRVRAEAPGGQAELVALDLASLASVEQCADEVGSRVTKLDVLVNNAGVMATPQGLTADGFETQFGTNHLGHFALTGRLFPLLQGGRVVTVSSSAHKPGKMRFDDLMATGGYRPWRAYSQSKLANLLFTAELDRRHGDVVLSAAAHPGYAATHLQTGQGSRVMDVLMGIGNKVLAQSDKDGALPQVYAATMPDVKGNEFFGPRLLELRGEPVRVGRTGAASSVADAQKLWDISEELTKVTF